MGAPPHDCTSIDRAQGYNNQHRKLHLSTRSITSLQTRFGPVTTQGNAVTHTITITIQRYEILDLLVQ